MRSPNYTLKSHMDFFQPIVFDKPIEIFQNTQIVFEIYKLYVEISIIAWDMGRDVWIKFLKVTFPCGSIHNIIFENFYAINFLKSINLKILRHYTTIQGLNPDTMIIRRTLQPTRVSPGTSYATWFICRKISSNVHIMSNELWLQVSIIILFW